MNTPTARAPFAGKNFEVRRRPLVERITEIASEVLPHFHTDKKKAT